VDDLHHLDDFDAADLAAASHTEATHPSWRQIA
jgi:hypothetical protein